jgi:wobble nucleotide-excising tRNase
LKAVQARHNQEIAPLCDSYIAEKNAKATEENLRTQARMALDNYRQNVFPAYEAGINRYLRRFNAGFRLEGVSSVNTRGGSAANYRVIINDTPVELTATEGASFRNTLSAGDRNTLALAFFFASLDHDPDLAQKIVIVDDPFTSLDEHRCLATIHEVRELQARVDQLIVMSHSKPFLFPIWDEAPKNTRHAMLIGRANGASTLVAWDINQDAITEHDKRHERARKYLRQGDPTIERTVAADLRPMLEAFLRVAYPAEFPPGTLLGPFVNACQQRLGTSEQILSIGDVAELRQILDYANRFHHDTNAACQTEVINDHELMDFVRRTLAFTKRS